MRLHVPVIAFLLLLSRTVQAAAVTVESRFGTERYVEYIPGDLPIVFTSPHGGTLRPESVPDRKEGVLVSDANSQQLARAMVDALLAQTGRRAALVASHLHRRKLDPNREIKEAAQGNAVAERSWKEYHDFISEALAAAVARHGFAFVVDIHGHAHPIARVELGFNLNAAQLNQDNTAFDRSDFAAISSLRDLHRRLGGSSADLIRGPRSLGALFAQQGVRAVPSPSDPSPGNEPFFAGGYTVQRHASDAATPKVDGLQFETPRPGIRDTPANQARFAQATAAVLTTFFLERYHYEMPRAARP